MENMVFQHIEDRSMNLDILYIGNRYYSIINKVLKSLSLLSLSKSVIALNIIICCTVSVQSTLKAQSTAIIVDDADDLPLSGVTIYLTDHDTFLISDKSGRVELDSKYFETDSTVQLRIELFSYKNQLISIESKQDIVVRMKYKSYDLDQVVITGQYEPTAVSKSVFRTLVIDNKQIDRMAAVNLRDVLTNQLQIRLSEDLILGSNMQMMGISGENVKILIDGVPVIGRLNGEIDLRQINLENIDHIEIIEGPMSVSYGSNALAGTINLISKKTFNRSYQIGTYAESNNTINNQISIREVFGKHRVSFTAVRNFFGGWAPNQGFLPNFSKQVADTSRVRSWNPRVQLQGELTYETRINGWQIMYRVSLFDEYILNRGRPRPPYLETAFDDTYKTMRFDNSLSLNGKLWNNWNTQVVASYNHFERTKNTYLKNLTNLETTLSEMPGDQDTSQFSQWMSRGTINRSFLSDLMTIEMGFDINHELNTGQRIEGQLQSISDFAFFSTGELKPLENLRIRPGIRIAYNDKYDAPILPSLHIIQSLSSWTIRASFARGFRAPSLKELYFFFVDINHNIQGNPDLMPESSKHINGSVKYNYSDIPLKLDFELSVFYNDIINMIGLAQSPDSENNLFSYFNIDHYRNIGGQFQLSGTYRQFNFGAGISNLAVNNSIRNVDNGPMYFNAQEYNTQINYRFDSFGTELSLFYKYQGTQPIFITNAEGQTVESFIAGFGMADLTIQKSLLEDRLSIALGCKNLFNITNVVAGQSVGVHSSAGGTLPIAMGRLVFARVQYKIIKP